MSDELEIVRSIALSFQERKDGWTRRDGRNLTVVNDELGIEVQEFGTRLSSGSRRYAISYGPDRSMRVEIDAGEAKDLLGEAMNVWREEAQASSLADLKSQLAAHLKPAK